MVHTLSASCFLRKMSIFRTLRTPSAWAINRELSPPSSCSTFSSSVRRKSLYIGRIKEERKARKSVRKRVGDSRLGVSGGILFYITIYSGDTAKFINLLQISHSGCNRFVSITAFSFISSLFPFTSITWLPSLASPLWVRYHACLPSVTEYRVSNCRDLRLEPSSHYVQGG